MGNGVFLRDWSPGDVVTAADLQELVQAVEFLEGVVRPAGCAVRGGGCRRQDDGPLVWPWGVHVAPGEDGVGVFVRPGRVVLQVDVDGGVRWAELPAGAVRDGLALVEDADAAAEVFTVFLELTGRVVHRGLTGEEFYGPGYPGAEVLPYEVCGVEDAVLRVCCRPVAGALRVWPLARVDLRHGQPVTQLLWGELWATECRGVADEGGGVLWPGEELRRVCAAPLDGVLCGQLADDGALELVLE